MFDAIQLKYLQSLTFAIFIRDEISEKDTLVETYSFNMTYPTNERAYLLNGQKVTRENVKQQAITLIRSLIEFGGTLDALPGDRYLTFRIQVSIVLLLS